MEKTMNTNNEEKICLCKGVTRGIILDAIAKGAKSFEDIKEATGAGTGGCRGARCKNNICEILEQNK